MSLSWSYVNPELLILILGTGLLLILGTLSFGPFSQPPLIIDAVSAADLMRSSLQARADMERTKRTGVRRIMDRACHVLRELWTSPEILGFLPSVWFWIVQVSLVTGIPFLYGWRVVRSMGLVAPPYWADASWPAAIAWLAVASGIVWVCLGSAESRFAEWMRELHPATRRYLGSEREL